MLSRQEIDQRMREMGLNITDLAEAIGCDKSIVSRLLRGGFRNPEPIRVQRMADVLNVPDRELFAFVCRKAA